MRAWVAWVAGISLFLLASPAAAQPYRMGDNPAFTVPEIQAEHAAQPGVSSASASFDLDAALLRAAQQGDAKEVKRLLYQGADAEAVSRDYGERTALMLAVQSGDRASVEAMIQGGANLQRAGSLPRGDRTVLENVTPLALATLQGDAANVAYLSERGAKPVPAVLVRRLDGMGKIHREEQPLLFLAKDARTVDALLAAGADPNERNANGATPLRMAAESGDRAMVERLLDAGADPGVKRRGGMDAYRLAGRAGQGSAAGELRAATPKSKRRVRVVDW